MSKTFSPIVWFFAVGVLQTVSAQGISVRVIDDHGKGVKSELFQIDNHGQKSRLNPTDDRGVASIVVQCSPGGIIKAVPVDHHYSFGRRECPLDSAVSILVTSVNVYFAVKKQADKFEMDSDFASAALLRNEQFARGKKLLERDSSIVDVQEVAKAEEKTYDMLGKFLNVEGATSYDPLQEKRVITPQFMDSIKQFQKKINMTATGIIDYKTLQAAAEQQISKYLQKQE